MRNFRILIGNAEKPIIPIISNGRTASPFVACSAVSFAHGSAGFLHFFALPERQFPLSDVLCTTDDAYRSQSDEILNHDR